MLKLITSNNQCGKEEDRMTLANVKNGSKASILAIDQQNRQRGKLTTLGLVPGTTIQMIDNSLHGASVINCRGNRLVLGKDMASMIYVKD